MRHRPFRPGGPDPLEGRALLSAAARSRPVGLSLIGYKANLATIQGDFGQYAEGNDLRLLRAQLAGAERAVPFGRLDGLGVATTAILGQMRREQAAGEAGAVGRANEALAAAIEGLVDARIADGSVRFYVR